MKKKHLILGLCVAVLLVAGSLVALTGCDGDEPTEPAPPPDDDCPNGPPQRPALPTLTSMIDTIPEGEMVINAADTPLQSLRVVRSGKEIAIYITLQ